MVATLDHLCEGRLTFGVGVGGEFPVEYAACGVPVAERGARLSEAIPLLKRLWTGEPVTSEGRFYPFPEVRLSPPARQPGGPPIWCGGRSEAALGRAARLADGWVSYVVTPDMYRDALDTIAGAAEAAGRKLERYGTGHLLFARIDRSYEQALDSAAESLSVRYAMDFRKPAAKYAALGSPADVAARIAEFHAAGVRQIIVDLVGPYEDRDIQIERFATEVRPLLADIAGSTPTVSTN
jgi:alkanesulfonate monooxygenase SsuD/methylene tetrahydromethanopterin reductase-like flavin-dependent oxidoreductase (luciferase family)